MRTAICKSIKFENSYEKHSCQSNDHSEINNGAQQRYFCRSFFKLYGIVGKYVLCIFVALPSVQTMTVGTQTEGICTCDTALTFMTQPDIKGHKFKDSLMVRYWMEPPSI